MMTIERFSSPQIALGGTEPSAVWAVPHGRRWLEASARRTIEIVLVSLMLIVLVPVLLALAGLVSISSHGPALYRQRRIGRDGRPFTMVKFRSMRADADLEIAKLAPLNDVGAGPLFKIQDDPRVTPVGRWMRKYSLDELPQLLNVLAGSMALVGPRPALPQEVAAYPPHFRRRLVVKPGLTGLWQIGGRSDLSWDESMALDLEYVDRSSLVLDLVILIRTVPAVLGGRGAY